MPAAAELNSDIEDLEEFERQTALRGNERTNHQRGPGHKFGWEISPNIARASASRESKKPPQTVAVVNPAPVNVEDREMIARIVRDARARWSAPIRSMPELVAAHRARRDELQITHETIDAIAGWAPGYAGKILAPDPIKNLGWMSLGSLLGTFGTMLLMVEDEEQIKRVQSRWTRRERPLQTAAPAIGSSSGGDR
jgi:hypothetical protein